jgi:hypothetical protein
MILLDRRDFLGATLVGLGASLASPAAAQWFTPAPPKDPARPDTLFLTWQRDPTTTVTIQWVAPESDYPDATVLWSPLLSDTWEKVTPRRTPYPLTPYTLFRAELTGLKPGTEYRFALTKPEKPLRFRTMPAKATNEFTFVSGGDCGINIHAINNNIVAAKQDPMFSLIGGDLGYDNGKSAPTSLEFLRNYSRHMVDTKGRLIPMVVCIGNHEVDGGYNKPRKNAPFFFALHDGLYSETSYATLDFGDYLSLVLLDTGHVSPQGGEQADWLDKTLAERVDRPHLIVVNHVPAYPSFRAPETADNKPGTGDASRKHWVPLFEKHNVDIVLEHHDHTFKRTHPLKDGRADPNGIIYLGDGSWGKLRVPKKPEARPYLASVNDSYHLTLHRLEGEVSYHLALEETGRVLDICTTRKKVRR